MSCHLPSENRQIVKISLEMLVWHLQESSHPPLCKNMAECVRPSAIERLGSRCWCLIRRKRCRYVSSVLNARCFLRSVEWKVRWLRLFEFASKSQSAWPCSRSCFCWYSGNRCKLLERKLDTAVQCSCNESRWLVGVLRCAGARTVSPLKRL